MSDPKPTIMDWLMERRTGPGAPAPFYNQVMENRQRLRRLYMRDPRIKAHITAAIAEEIPWNEMLVRLVLDLAEQNALLLKGAVKAAQEADTTRRGNGGDPK